MKRVYLDYAASSPVDPRVVEEMQPYFGKTFGNPSSVHSFGLESKEALEQARSRVAQLIRAESAEEIIFTSGGTESNNLAVLGVAYRNRNRGNHIITSTAEHISIMNLAKHLQKLGFQVTYVPVDRYGVVDVGKLGEAITDKTILISLAYANGEIGTIQPVREIGKIARDRGVYFHADAVAANGKIPIDVVEDQVDLLSLSSNDLYGPKGVGALYVRKGVRIEPIIFGGGQERGLRSGTENIPNIVGMGKAAEIAGQEMGSEGKRLSGLRDRLIKSILEQVKESYLNGHPTRRLPNNVHLRFSYIEGEAMLLSLDMEGIAASTGSACTSKTLEPSHVLKAIGLAHEEAHGSLLLTLGRWTVEEDVDYAVQVIPGVVERLRRMSPLTPKDFWSD
ncbi:cysteine desulfurase NifS [Candidatus Hecatella orcuttiae]|uniref:cysteine desulfurase NifS n=1 Tax=Candidatus Hecatella orcuttiae TaxID=1935119 RepID=UPI0031830CAD